MWTGFYCTYICTTEVTLVTGVPCFPCVKVVSTLLVHSREAINVNWRWPKVRIAHVLSFWACYSLHLALEKLHYSNWSSGSGLTTIRQYVACTSALKKYTQVDWVLWKSWCLQPSLRFWFFFFFSFLEDGVNSSRFRCFCLEFARWAVEMSVHNVSTSLSSLFFFSCFFYDLPRTIMCSPKSKQSHSLVNLPVSLLGF
jgi:hypothetical protein